MAGKTVHSFHSFVTIVSRSSTDSSYDSDAERRTRRTRMKEIDRKIEEARKPDLIAAIKTTQAASTYDVARRSIKCRIIKSLNNARRGHWIAGTQELEMSFAVVRWNVSTVTPIFKKSVRASCEDCHQMDLIDAAPKVFAGSNSERRLKEEREREAEAARQLEARVVEAFEAALVDRADDLQAELERRYQSEIDRRVKQRLDELERDYQRKLEEEKRLEEEEKRKQAELDRILEENNRKLMEARRKESVVFSAYGLPKLFTAHSTLVFACRLGAHLYAPQLNALNVDGCQKVRATGTVEHPKPSITKQRKVYGKTNNLGGQRRKNS
ncbi:arginine and glutamate-rich protein 1 [Clonorchis sinensis]|uniref:Arginine and glutamate-rich protein 1 n=1 Tax=Clonorchis sinensis TaxID=79923 RepID=G7YKX7_CLOSI|nr:arginine and glutamate-rich protein 1 [Clonorchis sinensis]